MIDNNPYAPPKSSLDLGVSINDFQPTKKQRLARVFLGCILPSVLFIPCCSFILDFLCRKFYLNKSFNMSFFDYQIIDTILFIIPMLIVYTIVEYCSFFNKYKIISFLIAGIFPVSLISFIPAPWFNISRMEMILPYIEVSIAMIMTVLILNIHYKYYEKITFRQPKK